MAVKKSEMKAIEQTMHEVDPAAAVAVLDPLSNARAVDDARRWPRSVDRFLKQVRQWTLHDEAAAENCIYSLPRAGKPIIGASIGFADILAGAYGNCRASSVGHLYGGKFVRALGIFKDLENNSELIASVDRPTVDKHGRPFNDDMQRMTMQAAVSIARRNVILHAVPPGLWRPIFEECKRIVRGDLSTFAETKDKAIKAMAQFGVKPEQVYGVLGLRGDMDLTLDHIPIIRGMWRTLRDGEITVEEMFDPRRMKGGGGFEQVEDPLGAADGLPEGEGGEEAQGTSSPAQAASAETEGDPGEGAPAPATASPAAPTEPSATQVAPAGQNAPAGSAAAASAPAAAPVDPRSQLRNEAEYMEYWRGFTAAAATPAVIAAQWARDRSLRSNCRIVADVMEEAIRIRTEAEDRLRAAGA